MIQPAAHSAKISLAANAGTNAGAAENGGIPAGFAALLALGMQDGEKAETAEALPQDVATALMRQMTGKTGGKILPDGLPDETGVAGKDAQGQPILAEEGDEDTADAGPEANPAAIIALPAALPAATARVAEKPNAGSERTGTATGSATTANTAGGTVTAPASDTGEHARSPQGNGRQAPVLTDILARFTPDRTETAALAKSPVLSGAPSLDRKTGAQSGQSVISINLRQSPEKGEAAAGIASSPAAAASFRNIPTIGALVSLPRPVLAAAQGGEPDSDAATAATVPTAKSLETQITAETAKNAAGAISADTVARPEQPGHADAKAPAATRQDSPVPAPQQQSADDSEAQSGTAKIASVKPGSDQPAQLDTTLPRAGDLQPVLAAREAQSLMQAVANTPVTTAAKAPQVEPMDFAALVDRLVEAREAASPHAVKASLSHTEFGQVSLRFDQNAGGMTVSMSSRDPDFAPAVQAATASHNANSGDNGANSGSHTPRHDAPGQQSAGFASGQPHEQSQGSARGHDRDRAQTFTTANSGQPTQKPDQSDGRDGIYA